MLMAGIGANDNCLPVLNEDSPAIGNSDRSNVKKVQRILMRYELSRYELSRFCCPGLRCKFNVSQIDTNSKTRSCIIINQSIVNAFHR